MGKLREAQEALQSAALISPNNSARQRMVGDVAARNQDFKTAERAYGKVLERRRGSSLNNIDDYSNLARAMLDLGHVEGAKRIAGELRRDWRGSKQGELAALVVDGLCANKEGDPTKARLAVEKALVLHDGLKADGKDMAWFRASRRSIWHTRAWPRATKPAPRRVVRKVAAENHQDRAMIAQIESIYAKTGNEVTGQALLAQVGKEIVDLNNRGVLAARSGDLDGSVKLLIEAAERVPNLQFLVNASKAIFTLLELKGWNPALAKRGLGLPADGPGKGLAQPQGDFGARDVRARFTQVRNCHRPLDGDAQAGRQAPRLGGCSV
jgi:tetratricopeptide (TPR) repeat protein